MISQKDKKSIVVISNFPTFRSSLSIKDSCWTTWAGYTYNPLGRTPLLPSVTICFLLSTTRAFDNMHYRWYFLFLQAYCFFSVSSHQTNRYSDIDNVANFVAALRVDAPTALNITGILGDYDSGSLDTSSSIFDVAKAICMSLMSCLPFCPRLCVDKRLKLLVGYNNSLDDQERASLACRVSSAVFKLDYLDKQTNGPEYYAAVNSSWSKACWLPAACVVQPESAHEVAKAMLIVTFLKSRFAVRSGGHNPNAGFASVDGNGVLIDTTKLNEVTLSEDKTLVRVGTGNSFRDVYRNTALTASGKSVVGGRTEAVGVGGYYLGGGMGFFSNTYGISASQVRNFEVRKTK